MLDLSLRNLLPEAVRALLDVGEFLALSGCVIHLASLLIRAVHPALMAIFDTIGQDALAAALLRRFAPRSPRPYGRSAATTTSCGGQRLLPVSEYGSSVWRMQAPPQGKRIAG